MPGSSHLVMWFLPAFINMNLHAATPHIYSVVFVQSVV